MRASELALEELHQTIATTLSTELKKYQNGEYDDVMLDEEGNEIRTRRPVPSSLIQSVIKYLKDNGIDRPASEEPDPSDLLADELPNFGE